MKIINKNNIFKMINTIQSLTYQSELDKDGKYPFKSMGIK